MAKVESHIGAPRWTRVGKDTRAERVLGYSVYHIEDAGVVEDVPMGEYDTAVAWLGEHSGEGEKMVDGKRTRARIWPPGYFLHEHREVV